MRFYSVLYCLIFFVFSCQDDSKRQIKLLEDLLQNQQNQLKNQSSLDSVYNSLNEVKRIQAHYPTGNLSSQFEKCKKSVYLIFCKVGEDVFQGSAFAIDQNGLCLSNFHVFDGAEKAIAVNYNKDKFEIDLTNIVKYNSNLDYIQFYINDPNIVPLNISNESPIVGDECFAIGNPNGLQLTLSNGIVSGIRKDDTLIQTTAEITHGSSGGPLFNTIGEVIGITSNGMNEANLNFAINIRLVLSDNLNENIPVDNIVYTNSTSNIETTYLEIKKEVIKNYYKNILGQDFESLSKMYNSNLNRFFSQYNVSSDFAIEDHISYYNKWDVIDLNVSNIQFQLIENSSDVLFESIIGLSVRKKSNGLVKSFVLKSYIVLNSGNFITSIYEEIISKN